MSFRFGGGGDEEWPEFLPTPETCRELVAWLHQHPTADTWKRDDWRDRCQRDFRRTTCALMHLAQRSEWIADRWREALQAWSDESLTGRSWRCLGGVLIEGPDDTVKELAHSLRWCR